MDWQTVYLLLKEFGPLMVLVVFFIWKDWRREDRLQKRVEVLEKEHKSVVLPLVERCATVIASNTAVMLRLEEVFQARHEAMQTCQRTALLLDRVLDRQTLLEQLKETPV